MTFIFYGQTVVFAIIFIKYTFLTLLSGNQNPVQEIKRSPNQNLETRGSKEPVSLTLVYVHIKQRKQMDS